MTKIILHGKLGKKFGKNHKFVINKPADAIKALIANKKGFYKAFKTWGRKGWIYQIICDNKIIDNEEELRNKTNPKEIHICPVIIGAGENAQAAFQAVLGTVLIVVGVMTGNPFLINAGIGLVIGGVMSLLFPTPTPTFESNVQSKSFLFSTTENSAVQGVPVPIGYGRMRIGSKVISTSLEPKRLRGGNTTSAFKAERSAEDLQSIQKAIAQVNTMSNIYTLGNNLYMNDLNIFKNIFDDIETETVGG